MPIQSTLGSLNTFKEVLPTNGYIISLQNSNNNQSSNGYFSLNDFQYENNNFYLIGGTYYANISNGSTTGTYIKLINDSTKQLPKLNYDAYYFYNDAGNRRLSQSTFLILNTPNDTLSIIGSISEPAISNTRTTQCFTTFILSNNNLSFNRLDQPDILVNNYTRSPQSVILANSNSITISSFVSNSTNTLTRSVKNYINNGALTTWEKTVRNNSNSVLTFISNFDTNNNVYTCYANNSIFNLSMNGNVVSNILTLSTSSTSFRNIIQSSNSYYCITNNPNKLAKFTSNVVNWEKSADSNTTIRSLNFSNNNVYVITTTSNTNFFNLVSFDANSGNINWQKNISFQDLNNNNLQVIGNTIKISNNEVFVGGIVTGNVGASFILNIPADGSNLNYNNFKIGDMILNISNGNLFYNTSSNLSFTTSANINVTTANATLQVDLGLTANTTNTWTYNSRRI